jgi:NADPH2:quinone reductase
VSGVGGWQETVVSPAASVLPLPDAVSLRAGAGVGLQLPHGPLRAAPPRPPGRRRDGARARRERRHRRRDAAAGQGVRRPHDRRRLHEAKVEAAREAGADEVVLPTASWLRAKELTGGKGVDVVMDPVGGDRFTDSLRSLAPRAGCSSSASPAARSPPSRSTACC